MKGIGKERENFDSEFNYSLIHVCLVFFIPAIIIFVVLLQILVESLIQVSYAIVLSWVWINSKPVLPVSKCGSFGCDTIDTQVNTRTSSSLLRLLQPNHSLYSQTKVLSVEWNPLRTLSVSKDKSDKKFRRLIKMT